MFLSAVILVLQESLEAALLLSVLLVLLRTGKHPMTDLRWALFACSAGLLGAWGYAEATPLISQWFDYVGLEVMNALIQCCILLCLMILCYTYYRSRHNRVTLGLMAALIALSIVREGSEIILYVSGVLGQPENASPVLLGGLTGAGIGLSSGVVLYYVLSSLSVSMAFRCAMLLLAFFAGNMAAQAVLLLTQADWLPYTPQLWDTSWLIAEFTVTGQLLYALVGYEANPSLAQVLVYALALVLIMLSPLTRKGWS